MLLKEVKSDIPDKIIKNLRQYKTVTFTDLREYLKVSNPVLSYHLKSLRDKKIIIFEKKGREKHYKLSKNVLKKFETKIQLISENYSIFFENELSHVWNKDIDENLILIRDMLGGFFLYSIFKSIETGQNWFAGFDSKEFADSSIECFNHYIFEDKEEVKQLNNILWKSMDEYFKEVKKRLDKDPNNKLDFIKEDLEKLFPTELQYLEGEAPNQWE